MSGYLGMFRMKFIAGMQYRASAWAGVTTQFFWGFMRLMVLVAFYGNSPGQQPMDYAQLASYTWLQQAFLALIMLWWQDGELLTQITSGHVAYELCRPYHLYGFWYARLVASRMANVAMRCWPILVVAGFLPVPYAMTGPAGWGALGLFALSLCLALLLVVASSMFIYILTFLTFSPSGPKLIVGVAAEFLMGALIPIPLMPNWLQRILDFLPFRYIADLPFRLYSGHIVGGEALCQLGIQCAWIVGLVLMGVWGFKKIMGRVEIQGG